jgi:hypothetical protein
MWITDEFSSFGEHEMSLTLDATDEYRAKYLRSDYGKVRWILSWHPQHDDGPWVARLSIPGYEPTIQAYGSTRCGAIDMATRVALAVIKEMGPPVLSNGSTGSDLDELDSWQEPEPMR